MTEPKLLTEAQAIEMWNQAQKSAPATFIEIFRERGLIAEEPVDPLLVEARQIIADTCDTHESKGQWLDGVWDDEQEMAIALAALHRGMELAPRKELTREVVREAVIGSEPNLLISPDFRSCYEETRQEAENFVDRLHAAIQEALQ
jgi:hypothetical protein